MEALLSCVCIDDFKLEADKVLPRAVSGFYNSGATSEQTLRENCEAIQRWYIKPRVLVDVSMCDLSTTILGHPIQVPFGIAPTAIQKMAHPQGECANARAADEIGSVFTLSSFATSSIEDVANRNGLRIFQLYIFKNRELTAQLVRRAEESGYKAIALSADSPSFGIRYVDIRNKFELPSHLRMANFENGEGDSCANARSLFDPALTWKDVAWLKSITHLPIILKGILTVEDAVNGVKAGAAAIWVSNHGARQVDGFLATTEVLPDIVAAVGDKCEVYVDGGFRTGSDIFKGLALGARMVFLGRPLLWGLACGGAEGAYKVLSLLREELRNTLTLSGIPSVREISRNSVCKRNPSKL